MTYDEMSDNEILDELATPIHHNLHDSALGIAGQSWLVPANHFLSFGGRIDSHDRIILFSGNDGCGASLICVLEE